MSERDGPFDLKPSEVVELMERAGCPVTRKQAVAFSSWAYNTYCVERDGGFPDYRPSKAPDTHKVNG